jgi:leucyl/phenylalanyl-tRNA--protein transferase
MLPAMDDARPPIIDPALLLLAYRSGIFPMADRRDDPDVFWVEPKRRGIHARWPAIAAAGTLPGSICVTCNAAFADVVAAWYPICAIG